MAEYWDQIVSVVEGLLPSDIAEYETEAVIVAVITTLLAFVVLLWCLCGGGRRKGRRVCLLGLSNSGKTLLFMRLIYGQHRETHVSIKENKADYTTTHKATVEVIDVPGDERVRQRIFNKYKESLRAVVVLIDSDNFPKEVRAVAELVYDLLLEPTVHKGGTPLLMACNKQDLPLAKDCSAIQKQLEKEITSLRVSRSAKLSSLGSKGQSVTSFIGQTGKDFEFSDLPKRVRVKFTGCSARGRGQETEAEIDNITTWIDQNC